MFQQHKECKKKSWIFLSDRGINHKTKKDRFWGKEPEPLEYVPAEHSKHIDEDDFPDDKEIKIIGSCIATLQNSVKSVYLQVKRFVIFCFIWFWISGPGTLEYVPAWQKVHAIDDAAPAKRG